jgi:glycosyltransferase 2 family protein
VRTVGGSPSPSRVTAASGAPGGWGRAAGLAATLLRHPAARALGTAAGLLLLLRAVDLSQAVRRLADVSPAWLAAGTALTGLALVLGVVCWGVLLRGDGPRPGWPWLVSVYLRALVVGQLVPGGVGGDAVRVLETGRRLGSGRALAAVVGSRLAGALGIAVWGAVGAWRMRDRIPGIGLLPAAAASALAGLAALLWAALLASDGMLRRLGAGAGPVRRLLAAVRPFTGTFDVYARRPRMVAAVLASGVAGWGINLLALATFAHAVGIGTGPTTFALVIPISLLGTLAPFSLNGLGLREGILVGLLAHDGISTAQAASVSLLVDLQMLPFAVAGALVWAAHRRAGAAPVPAAAPALVAAEAA